MFDSIEIHPRTTTLGCGIYQLGDPDKSFCLAFITDSGRVLPLTGRIISHENLMEVYKWGRYDERDEQDQDSARLFKDVLDEGGVDSDEKEDDCSVPD